VLAPHRLIRGDMGADAMSGSYVSTPPVTDMTRTILTSHPAEVGVAIVSGVLGWVR
jgi:hypothetical protein